MARAYTRVRMDIDRDGQFITSVNDIDLSSDVIDCHITRGVEVDKWRHPASICELKLKNSDHKYSPYSGSGIFAGYTSPGFPLFVELCYPADFFTNTATDFTGRTAEYDPNFAWTGDVTQFEIVSGAARARAAGDYKIVLDFGESDGWLHVNMSNSFTIGVSEGLVFRYSDASNYWLIRNGGGAFPVVTKVVAGVPTDVLTLTDMTTMGGEMYVLLCGNYIHVFKIVGGWPSAGGPTLYGSVSDSFNATATKHGIGGYVTTTTARYNEFGGFAPQFYGLMDTIIPHPEPADKTAYLRAFDAFENLAKADIYWANAGGATQRVDQLVDSIATDVLAIAALTSPLERAAILDTDGRTVIADTNTVKAFTGKVLENLYKLQDDEGGGLVYVHELGGLCFESVQHRRKHPHVTPLKTWYWNRNAGTEDDIFVDAKLWEWDGGFDRIENMAHVSYYKISRSATGTELWRLQLLDRPPITAGQTLYFVAVGDGDGITTPVTPVANTDYTLNTAADGSGLDLTPYAVVAISSSPVMLGNHRRISVTNNSGVHGYITFLQLRAERVTNSVKLMGRAENSESQGRYGVRLTEHQSVSIDNYEAAVGAAKDRIAVRSEARERVTFRMTNATKANMMQIAHRRVSDHVRLIFTPFGMDKGFFIEKKDIEISQGGTFITCEWTATRATGAAWGSDAQGALWDGTYNWSGGKVTS